MGVAAVPDEAEGWGVYTGSLESLQQALAEFPKVAGGQVSQAIEHCLLVLQGAAADYPPAPPGSSYIRTGTLGRLWTSATRVVEQVGAWLMGRVDNATPYGPFVQDPERQAWMHVGRWLTTDKIVEQNLEVVAQILEDAGGEIVHSLAQRVGG